MTREQIRGDVAEVLGVPLTDIEDTANLLDEGLDSIRAMTLVERWRSGGTDVDLVDLVAEPTIDAWVEVTQAA
ncbi:isochorismatase [Rhodococcus triatomae]|nr:isochorismatase [Rhodococcus triatomae]QNG25719.1 isochorismatase [Rhodococcus triatomae]